MVEISTFSQNSVSEKFDKPLLRLMQRIQEILFDHLKTVVQDRRLRSLHDLDSGGNSNLVDFSIASRMLRNEEFFKDTVVSISVGKVPDEVSEADDGPPQTQSPGQTKPTEGVGELPIRQVLWSRFAFYIISSIMRSKLPELCHMPEFLERSDLAFELPALGADEGALEPFLQTAPWVTVLAEIAHERRYFDLEDAAAIARKKTSLLRAALEHQPAVGGPWRKTPVEKRDYEKLNDYVVTATIPPGEQVLLLQQLNTPMETCFRGPAYNFDDGQLTEEWMCSFRDHRQAGPTDDDVVKVLTTQTLELMLGMVQDRVCTGMKILESDPLNLDSASCCEQLVWGIDCACRRLVEISIQSRMGGAGQGDAQMKEALRGFVESRLLPAINGQIPDRAHSMLDVVEKMVHMPVLPVDATKRRKMPWAYYTDLEHRFAEALLGAVTELGIDSFRIHPKGTGVVCTAREGIAPHKVVCEYLGELYPPYRWCERMDILKQAQRKFHLKPALPDFYNILLERPRQDPNGYGLLFVDAAQRSNIGSTLAHSCNNNCTSAVVPRNGRLTIVLTSSRFIAPGEEISHDYGAVTASEEEWRASVCLCGSPRCRGRFLHFSDEDPVQRILEQHCGPTWRYAALLRACGQKPLAAKDLQVLERHGVKSLALGMLQPGVAIPRSKVWMQKFAADMLHFIEHERAALPCALLRNQADFVSTFVSADWDARTVMEQRIQSLCCAFSMVQRVLDNQPISQTSSNGICRSNIVGDDDYSDTCASQTAPLLGLDAGEIAEHIWSRLMDIPSRILEFAQLLQNSEKANGKAGAGGGDKASVRLRKGAKEISDILKHRPPTLHKVAKEQCIAVRNIIRELQDTGDRLHRLRLLADVLSMWAHTSHFSTTRSFAPVRGEDMTIVARELGSSVLRAHIQKHHDDIHALDKSKVNPPKRAKRDNGDVETNVLALQEIPLVAVVSLPEKLCNPASKILHPEEAVFTGKKEYDPNFVFWQMMQWFNAGTEKDVRSVNIFGGVQLPEPHQCFGHCEGQYSDKVRQDFLTLLRGEKTQALPWPAWLQACFSKPMIEASHYDSGVENADISNTGSKNSKRKKSDPSTEKHHFYEKHLICGSPMLDVCLGLTHAVRGLLRDIGGEAEVQKQVLATKGKRKRKDAAGDDDVGLQPDDILPPEDNTAWVQCDKCHAWRRLPWNIDSDSLGDDWHCALNTWDVEMASCGAAADTWDPNSEEITAAAGGESNADIAVDSERDVFCLIDQIYYEGTVVRVKAPGEAADSKKSKNRGDSAGGESGAVLFKFRFFGNMYLEWMPADSDRIRPLHMFTDGTASSLEQAQAYQGLYKQKPSTKKKRPSSNPFKGLKPQTSFAADGTRKTRLKDIFGN